LIAAMTGITAGVIAAGSAHGTLRAALALFAALLTIGATARAFRLSVSATSSTVSVRNYVRSYDFDWNDVQAVGVGLKTMGIVPQSAFAFLVAMDGKERDVRAQATPINASARSGALSDLQRLAPSHVRFTLPV
jgi:hypothetical protein